METGNQVPEIKNTIPKISVVVPAYNIEQYLPRCIDSILEQSYHNMEVILVDDGSKDDTGRIADAYAEQNPGRVKVIHLENGGVTHARLAGIREASGEWIGFVDGDDVIEPDMYQRLMDNAIRYHADISHCGYQTIVNDGERVHYFYNTGRLVQQDKATGLKDLLSGEFIEPGLWNKLFHKSLFGGLTMPIDIRINEDLLMNFYLFKESTSAIYEDFCPYHYMTRTTSASRSGFNEYKVLDPVKVWKIILRSSDADVEHIVQMRYLKTCMSAYAMLYGKKEYRGVAKELKAVLIKNKKLCKNWRKNDRIKLKLVLWNPFAFRLVDWIYQKTIQNKIYE